MDKEILRNELTDLFLFTFFNDLSSIKKFKTEKPNLFYKSNLFPLDGDDIFDLYYLTKFNEIIWNTYDGWKKELLPFVRARRNETKQVLDFWQFESKLYRDSSKFDFSKYWNYFYSENPEIRDYTNWKPNKFFLQKNIKEIDLMLYNRAECFDIKETKNLLKRGANPNIDLYEEDEEGDTILDRIATESAHLFTQIIPLFQSFEKEKYKQYFDLKQMFRDILGLAAHEEMYKVLKTTKPNKWMIDNQ